MKIIWSTPWIKFIFNRCLHSLAAAEPAKYKRNIKKKTKKIVVSGNKWFSILHLISARLVVGRVTGTDASLQVFNTLTHWSLGDFNKILEK